MSVRGFGGTPLINTYVDFDKPVKGVAAEGVMAGFGEDTVQLISDLNRYTLPIVRLQVSSDHIGTKNSQILSLFSKCQVPTRGSVFNSISQLRYQHATEYRFCEASIECSNISSIGRKMKCAV